VGINRAVTPYKQELARKLNIFQLTAFGMNYIMPFAPAIIFGIIAKQTGTTVALPYLLALIVMSFTANSYVYMVKRNPVAGSLYSYVESILGRKIGFLAGWILFLDYILVPTVVAISATLYLRHYFPDIPYNVILPTYVILTGLINLLGISIVANLGLILLIIMEIILVSCLIVLGDNIISNGHNLVSSQPFYFSSTSALFTATTLCVLSYLGYDAISTLAEEAKNPVRDVPKAIIFSVIFSGMMMFLIGYLGVLSFPNIPSYFNDSEWVNSALFYIINAASGPNFTAVFTGGVILCMVVFNVVGTAAGSRLLFGMGRDRVLPREFFGKINKKFKTPHFNILLIMTIELILGLSISLDTIVNLVNYGAILGFAILNFSVFIHIYKKNSNRFTVKKIIALSVPLLGTFFMIILMIMMEPITLIVGSSWAVLGIIYMFFNKYLTSYTPQNNTSVFKNNSENVNNVKILHPQNMSELSTLKTYWNYDHWNISDNLLNLILFTDKQSMITVHQNDEIVGSIVAYNYNEKIGYFGLFYVLPEYRGTNFGAYLTGAAIQRWGNRAVACDAVYSQVLKYKKIGFSPVYENKRFVFTAKSNSISTELSNNIQSITENDLNEIINYDANHFYTNREQLLTQWINLNLNHTYIYREKNKIRGIIALSPSHEAYRIGPFFADNPEIAIDLFKRVTENLTDELVHIDIPLINENIHKLINACGLVETSMRFIRMHKGNLTIKNINNVYGHLSIELG
jgi:amino acid transporter/GNAT superfamily N-acetyltransferase